LLFLFVCRRFICHVTAAFLQLPHLATELTFLRKHRFYCTQVPLLGILVTKSTSVYSCISYMKVRRYGRMSQQFSSSKTSEVLYDFGVCFTAEFLLIALVKISEDRSLFYRSYDVNMVAYFLVHPVCHRCNKRFLRFLFRSRFLRLLTFF